ncbi:MAG: hypothetical protein GOV02_03155 [Candidatus Aenigmarchaeota archaeon]|nr:hypothetical protein [Candidatus Aenigmarchaeota archaeon]
MAKIVDPDDLNQGTEIIIDATALTIALQVAGNLSWDGVSLKALYSFIKEEWRYDADLIPVVFPFTPITDEQFELINGWDFADSTSELLIRDGGWAVTDVGVTSKSFFNLTTLGSFEDSNNDRAYYIQQADQTAVIYTNLAGEVNQGIQFFQNGVYDYSDFFKIFLREQGKRYDSYDLLTEQNLTSLTYRKYALPLSNSLDANISASDNDIETDTGAAYSTITVSYYSTVQNKDIGGTLYPFHVVIDAAGLTKDFVYEKIQYLLRQDADIDAGPDFLYVWGTVTDELLQFIGNDLYTNLTSFGGTFIENHNVDDENNIFFTDDNGVVRFYPFVSTGQINFNDNLQNDPDAFFWMFYTTNPSGNYGTKDAIIVQDASDSTANDIAALINGAAAYQFTYDYDNNNQGGRTPATDADITLVAIGLDTAQYVSTTGTIARAKSQQYSLVAPLERNYSNP